MGSLAKDFEAEKKKIEQAELKQRRILSGLYQLNKKVKKIVTEKGVLSQQRAFLEVNVRNLSQKIAELEDKNRKQRSLLAERLRAMYKLGGASVARFLFSSSSSSSLERNLKVLGVVAGRDLELIKSYSKDLRAIEEKKRSLAKKLESMQTVETKIAMQETDLRREQALKGRILDGIRRNKLFSLKKIHELREKSLQYNVDDVGLFDLLFKPSFADHKGALPVPVDGVVTQKFGLMRDQEHPYTLTHKGVFISAAKGSPFKAVFEGKVSYVGTLPGFGKTLVLDHGDHYYSVYAHAQEVKVNLGDEVQGSQTLAEVSEAPAYGSPGLYFEIRHFSEPYDPQQWMKGL